MVLSEKCDIVVLETGMGGLLDATNVIPAPLLCVLRPSVWIIWLFWAIRWRRLQRRRRGLSSREAVWFPCRQLPEAMGVIEEACKEKGCELFVSDMESAKMWKYGLEKQRFSL